MRHEVANDLSDSAFEFQRIVWPAIKDWVGGGEIRPVESVAHSGFDKELDTLSGIDAWHLLKAECAIRGIASRVQWGEAWNTYTIRYSRPSGIDTEYQKRIKAIDNQARGYLIPQLTIQAYASHPKRKGRLLSASVVRTKDLFDIARSLVSGEKDAHLSRKMWGFRKTYSGEVLLWIKWQYLAQRRVKCKQAVFSEDGSQQSIAA